MDPSLGFLNSFGDVLDFDSPDELNEAVNDYADLVSRHTCENPVDVPGSPYKMRCNSRSAKFCAGCSLLYRGDWRRIAFSGVFTDEGDVLSGFDYYFVTRTGPSFGGGGNHYVPRRWKNDKPGPTDLCIPCTTLTGTKTWHHPERDWPFRGQPLDMETYDFDAHYQFNKHHQLLFESDVKRIRRKWKIQGLSKEQNILQPAYFGVKEPQSRLVVHLHTIWRFSKHSGPADAEELKATLEGSEAVNPDTGELMSWGEQFDVQPITGATTNKLGTAGHAAVIGYALKTALSYTMKDATELPADDDWHPSTEDERNRQRFVQRLRQATYDDPNCTGCIKAAKNASTISILRAAGSHEKADTYECKHPRHSTFGVGTRPMNKSASWSLTGATRLGCMEERRRWVEEKQAHESAAEVDPGQALLSQDAHNERMMIEGERLHNYRGTPVEELGQEEYRQRRRQRAQQKQEAELEQPT